MRPPELLEAQAAYVGAQIGSEQLREIEAKAIILKQASPHLLSI
jgi:hypothetical protein